MSIILWEVPDFFVDQKINREIDTDTGELSVNFVGEGQHLESCRYYLWKTVAVSESSIIG